MICLCINHVRDLTDCVRLVSVYDNWAASAAARASGETFPLADESAFFRRSRGRTRTQVPTFLREDLRPARAKSPHYEREGSGN